MTYLAHIADRLLGRPLLLTEDKAEVLLSVLQGRIGLEGLAGPEASAFKADRVADSKMARMTASGIAVVPVIGTLVNRGAWIGANSGLVSYEGLYAQLEALATDASVKGILLDMNTPGGEAASGAFEVPKLIRSIRATKPVFAVANDMIASAGYSIASAASQIFVNDLSITGSIGVIMIHLDRSREMTMKGVTPTFIRSDADKATGNALEPLSAETLGLLKAEVDRIKTTFVQTVVAGRSMTEAQVRALGAGVFHGADAIKAGLADRMGTFADALTSIEAMASTGRPLGIGARRAEAETPEPRAASEPQPTTETPMSTAAQTPASASDAPAASQAPAAPATPAAATPDAAAIQSRIEAILDSPEAKGREALARRLAFKTTMPATDAIEALKDAPQAKAVADPIVGAGVTQPSSPASALDRSDYDKGRASVAAYNQARGLSPRPAA